jgi:hypothetical protein
MPQFKNLNELEKYLNQKISSALQKEVFETVRETMKDEIKKVVYDAYSPKKYKRQTTRGLQNDGNIKVTPIGDNTIEVENTRSDDGKNVAETVITGHGYDYGFEFAGVPRDFIKATADELKRTEAHTTALIAGLKERGVIVSK